LFDLIDFLFVDAGAYLNLRDNRDKTALIHASEYGHGKTRMLLTEAGAQE